jgi:hypothetical protein
MKLSKRPDATNGIPNIILIATQWIKDHCADAEGIFRKSGSLAQVEDLKARIDQGSVSSIEDEEDEHVVANIIKLFFREMPVPLIPYSHYSHYMDIGLKLAEEQIPTPTILGLLSPHLVNLPKPHLNLLIFLLKFLAEISKFADATKMDTANLAIVFANNVIKCQEESIDLSFKFNHVNFLFKLMIEEVDEIVAMLPKDNNEGSYDNWLQDLIKYTRTSPIYIEDPPSAGQDATPVSPKAPVEKEVVSPPKPETRTSRAGSETEKSSQSGRKSGKSSGLWSAWSKDSTPSKEKKS